MADTDDDHELEAGLGVPIRAAIRNAINGKKDLGSITANHFARVTGHSPSSGWTAFSKSMEEAFIYTIKNYEQQQSQGG